LLRGVVRVIDGDNDPNPSHLVAISSVANKGKIMVILLYPLSLSLSSKQAESVTLMALTISWTIRECTYPTTHHDIDAFCKVQGEGEVMKEMRELTLVPLARSANDRDSGACFDLFIPFIEPWR
jgi:hypothetical protein